MSDGESRTVGAAVAIAILLPGIAFDVFVIWRLWVETC